MEWRSQSKVPLWLTQLPGHSRKGRPTNEPPPVAPYRRLEVCQLSLFFADVVHQDIFNKKALERTVRKKDCPLVLGVACLPTINKVVERPLRSLAKSVRAISTTNKNAVIDKN